MGRCRSECGCANPKHQHRPEEERAEDAAEVEVNEQDLPDPKDDQAEEQELPLYVLHRIAKNESLEVLAEQYGCSDADLIELNPELSKGSIEGRYIIVPNPERMRSKAPSDSLSTDTNGLRISVLLPFSESGADTLDATLLRTAQCQNADAGIFLLRRCPSGHGQFVRAGGQCAAAIYDTGDQAALLDSLAQLPELRSSIFSLGRSTAKCPVPG